jgi:hypothetical protein
LQHPYSTVCGEWCILFLLLYYSNHELTSIYDLFQQHSDLLSNDYLVNKFIFCISGVKNDVIDKPFLEKQMMSLPKWRNVFKWFQK